MMTKSQIFRCSRIRSSISFRFIYLNLTKNLQNFPKRTKIFLPMSEPNENNLSRPKNHLPLILSGAATLAMVIFLFFQGSIWWCRFGDISPYYNDAWSRHTSQHFFDPYSFTHILHGVIFFW